jgi:hypothetical protein
MEKIILLLIGATAVFYVFRLMWKEAKGEVQCHCSQGSCNSKNGCRKS